MGTGIRGRCERCGYEATSTVGGGMRDFRERADAPAMCQTCRRVVTVNLLAKPLAQQTCRRCRRPLELVGRIVGFATWEDMRTVADWSIDDEDGAPSGQYVLEDKPYPCPRCEKAAMAWWAEVYFD